MLRHLIDEIHAVKLGRPDEKTAFDLALDVLSDKASERHEVGPSEVRRVGWVNAELTGHADDYLGVVVPVRVDDQVPELELEVDD